MPALKAVNEVEPKLQAVADWLRNEKRSGLHNKEAIQYEKVCRRLPGCCELTPLRCPCTCACASPLRAMDAY